MPLASRATTARAARTDASVVVPPKDEIKKDIQPRRNAASAPPPVDPPADTSGAQNAAQSDAGSTGEATPPAKAPRKQRTPRATLPGSEGVAAGAPTDVKALKARQKAIEVEFKQLSSQEQVEMRALVAKFATQRKALESEHRLLANQLSAAVFKG